MSRDEDEYRLLIIQIGAALHSAKMLKLTVLSHLLEMAMLEAIGSFQDNKPPP
jgi:hypothetical protein